MINDNLVHCYFPLANSSNCKKQLCRYSHDFGFVQNLNWFYIDLQKCTVMR